MHTYGSQKELLSRKYSAEIQETHFISELKNCKLFNVTGFKWKIKTIRHKIYGPKRIPI